MKAAKMRRSVSFAAVTYVRMWLHCHRNRVAMSAWVDGLVTVELDLHDAATPSHGEAHAAINSIRGLKSVKTQGAKLRAVLEAMKPAPPAAKQRDVLSGNGHFL